MSLNYLISKAVSSCIMQTVRLVAKDGWRLLGDNRFEPPRDSGGTARDRSRLPPPHLGQVTYDEQGSRGTRDTTTTTTRRSPSSSATSRRPAELAAATLASGESIDDLVSDDFEHLR